jgi:peroxiredoxin (alkyl hydroperoxide reductase subunit C)
MAVLVGRQAPDFNVSAVQNGQVIENFTLSQFHNKKYVVLFFYPLDFTFVCPTELHEFEARRKDFEALGAEVIGCSIDSPHSHLAWLNTPMNKGGIQGVQYPIVSDLNKAVAQSYDVLLDAGMALRASFVIDKKGVVQIQHINNLDIGRSVDEVYRALQALQFTEEHGEVCPANWKQGDKSMKATREGVEGFFKDRK